ncbi:MAG TPA: mannitol dehydrogenase family protein [Acidimicrobiales bacterium]|nr:mannitol dehydrogenase family protein [Acidimicrobiales bacterium]
MTALRDATLRELSTRVAVPSYDRSGVTAGIVHFGVGAFHRAHEAMYLDTLMNNGQASDWGICGVGLLPLDRRMSEVLKAQDGLYTLVLKHPDGTWEPRVIGSLTEHLFAPDNPSAVLDRLCSPEVRVVSLTITEGGYGIHRVTGRFDPAIAGVTADLAPGCLPTTVFGFVTQALHRRYQAGVPPFTVVSCDNVQGNGDVAREAFTSFAELVSPELASWARANVHFPNSMVDRITPATTDRDRAEVAARFGVEDGWPVLCEPFVQWALEDTFSFGRPPLQDAGVQLVADVAPYELMKLRLLNASHQALCYAGYLAGYRLVHEVVRDPLFAQFLLGYMIQEAMPTLQPVPGIDLPSYARELIDRFSNPEVADTVARLCTNGSDLIPKFLLPVVRYQLEAGGSIRHCATVIACWARYAEGTDEDGAPIDIVDHLKDRLVASARQQRTNPTAFLENRDIFGDLVDDPRFATAYVETLASLHDSGARATLQALTSPG